MGRGERGSNGNDRGGKEKNIESRAGMEKGLGFRCQLGIFVWASKPKPPPLFFFLLFFAFIVDADALCIVEGVWFVCVRLVIGTLNFPLACL